MALLQKAYLGATPLFRDNPWFANAGNPQAGDATVTASASTNSKGAWAEIISSTSANASLMLVFVRGLGANTVNTAALLDIGTGASGSETAIVSNVAVGSHGAGFSVSTSGEAPVLVIPFKVPSSTRLSARIQCATASRTANVFIAVADYGDYGTAPTSVDVIGGNTANSEGVGLATSGTWTEITASTSRAYRAVVMVPSMASTARGSSQNGTYEVAVGASGSEQSFGTINLRFNNSEQCQQFPPILSLFTRSIAAGSRLSVRQNITTANPSELQATLIGIP
jgi:hypothetical protein